LYKITKEKDAEIEDLKGRLSKLEFLQKENEGLRERLATLEAMVTQVIQWQKEGR